MVDFNSQFAPTETAPAPPFGRKPAHGEKPDGDKSSMLEGLFSGQSTKRRRSGVSKTDLMLVTTQLSIMTRAGMDLADAVATIARQSQNAKVRVVLERVHSQLQEGKSFSSALAEQVHVFGEAFVASVAAGEASGNLTDVLMRLKDLLRNDVRMRSTIRGTLMYPIILAFVAITVVAAMVLFVLPQFATVFRNMGRPAPFLTQLLLDTGEFLRGWIWLLGFLFCLSAFGIVRFWSSPPFQRLRDRVLLNTHGLRNGVRALLTGRVFRLIGTMLVSGVPFLDSIRLCRRAVGNIYYRDLFDQIEEEVLAGKSIAPILASASCIPGGAAEMIATAERTGNLGIVMEMVGEFYEDEGERRVRDLVRLLEPAIIVVMGVIVAFIVAAVMLPLFDLSSSTSHM